MTSPRQTDDDHLDALLNASSPPAPLAGAATETDLATLVAEARTAAIPPRPGRTRRHLTAVSAAVVLGLAGAGAAAATVTDADWLPWAQEADVIFTYTLPSGAVCEERIGDVGSSGDPEAVEATREFFRDNDVLALADVDAMIAQIRQEDASGGEDGTEVSADDPDAQPMSADMEYGLALGRAISDLVTAELRSQGFDTDAAGVSYSGQAWCPGADW
ncbi:hypothetical protein EXU48_08880 [Occultella glacieicola]|uniref:Uncharacterized protein n=1 Tax=Occultella glacieicola TaxID=2518684 RepID=A0ABY2E4D5_9MICO|nr:hypothetical protein [Occultella glacieicola]TDE94890.1 hypothetical protein EXU48_08880 [Occultella glacieicola]